MGLSRDARICERTHGFYCDPYDAKNNHDNLSETNRYLPTYHVASRKCLSIGDSRSFSHGEFDRNSRSCSRPEPGAVDHSEICVSTSTGVFQWSPELHVPPRNEPKRTPLSIVLELGFRVSSSTTELPSTGWTSPRNSRDSWPADESAFITKC